MMMSLSLAPRYKWSLIFIILFTAGLRAQEKNNLSYLIRDKATVTDVQPYIDAMSNSDMKNHRLKNKRYTVVFQSGLTIELFSANEMKANGFVINPEDYPDSFDVNRQEPVFALGANNFIIEYYTVKNKQEKVLTH